MDRALLIPLLYVGDVSLLIKDSFFCAKSSTGEARVCCPLDGIDPPIQDIPAVEDKGIDGCILY